MGNPLPASARRRKPRRRGRDARRRAQVAARSAWLRTRQGVLVHELPANLPAKRGLAGPVEQAAWLSNRLPARGVGGVVECSPALVKAMRARGLHVHAAPHNPGGVGNAAASRMPFVSETSFACSYTANDGDRVVLHMARVVTKPGRFIRHTHDVVHVPSRGRYDTSTSELEQRRVIRQIALRKASTRSRTLTGDWNTDKDTVLDVLQSVDKRWRYLGGAGVEMTFGLRVRGFGDTAIRYSDKSDHQHTARSTYGVRGRLG